MLRITIPASELFNEATNEFISSKGQTLSLEHSLVSLSKWESKYHKPFLGKEPKSVAESIEYIKCMTLTQNVNPNVYNGIDDAIINQVEAYIQDPMTATWFSKKDTRPPSRQIITSEVIYHMMIVLGIPFECQKWHLNRLLTLIRVCNEKSTKPKKLSKRELASRNTALNMARRKAYHSKG